MNFIAEKNKNESTMKNTRFNATQYALHHHTSFPSIDCDFWRSIFFIFSSFWLWKRKETTNADRRNNPQIKEVTEKAFNSN